MNTMYEVANPMRQTTLTQPVTLAQNGPKVASAKSSYQVEFVFSAQSINIMPTYQDTTAPITMRTEP